MAALSSAAGWYGKVSGCGDFVQRRLAPEFVAGLDAWLARSMQASQEALGTRWLQVYLHAPLLRFAWAPGIFDAQWWFGLLMPSCDSVGRYFPLVIVQPRAQPPADRIALDHLELWHEHLGAAALQTLHDQASLEAFDCAVVAAPPWPTAGWPVPGASSAARSPADAPASGSSSCGFAVGATAASGTDPCAAGQRHALTGTNGLARWVAGQAAEGLAQRLAGSTLWWRQQAEGRPSNLTVCRGLPRPNAFGALLADE